MREAQQDRELPISMRPSFPRKAFVPWRPKPNIAKRARALGIMKRKGIKPLTKAEARKLCAEAVEPKI